LFCHVLGVGLGPFANSAYFIDQGFDHLGVLFGIRLGSQIELMVVSDATGVTQGARLQLLFGGCLVRVPDYPGIDTAAFKGSTGIGGGQEHGLDIGVFKAGVFKGAHQQVVHVGAFVEDDFFAFEIFDRGDGRILGHQNRFAGGGWWLVGDVEQVGAGGLGEHGRGFAGHAEVDGAHVQAFKQLRATGEFGPLHVNALLGQALVQRAFGLEQHQRAVFLIADAQGIGLGLGNSTEGHSRS